MSSKTSASSSTSSTSSSAQEKSETSRPKVDPSFKSKRYRDKLRTEVKALEALLPVDRTALSRKLDSQTVFRLVIAFLRTKGYCQAAGLQEGPEATNASHGDNKRSRQRHNSPSAGVHVPSHDDPQELIQGLSGLQVLDGFLLVLTADGTILYVSDNVLQYLGYNQVDLMHRCLYSIIHHDDMLDLKMVLESSSGHLVTHYEHHDTSQEGPNQHLEDCSLGGGDTCKPVSFICRMRCFSGSSVGYLKMHCSGKLVHMPGFTKSKRFSGNVVLLFCNPFMLRAAEFTTDLQKNVFWSKHDLDLNIKEIDKKGADIIGFDTDELEKRSFYSLIHPEDLTTVVSCHRMLVESTEVQTVYFRLQTKGGDWVWLTSRGKVISKNSKKFSIAFSHCPLREEDSTYIQQEAVLRRRYAISDLMCMSQFKHTTPPFSQQLQREEHLPTTQKSKRTEPNSKNSSGASSKADSKKDSANLLDTSCIMEVACPSAWHALSDRHSPVLPSSHVAHKISQREKQLQFQEFCRRQQLEIGCQDNNAKADEAWDVGQQFPITPGVMVSSETLSAGLPAPVASTGMSFATASGLQMPGGHLTNGQAPNGLGAYPGYNCMPVQTSGVPYMTWQNGSSSGSFVDTPSPVSCLTPSRSPHQHRGPASHAATSAQPAAYSSHVPPYDSLYSHSVPCSSMPPSPPPSPPNCHRPVPSYQCSQQEVGDISAMGYHSVYSQKPEWPPRHPYFPYQTQQPPPYPKKNSTGTEAASSSSTITDLQKTTEKFLQVKEEVSCDSRQNMNSHQDTHFPDYRSSWSDMWCKPPWAFSGQVMGDRPVVSTHSVLGYAESAGGFAGFSQPYPRNMDFSRTYLHPEQQNVSFAVSQPLTYNTAPHRAPPASLGSPPAYPYAIYPQTVAQGPQIHVNGFYGAQVVPVKTVDFARPVSEHPNPLDLPSIGSFLEYLNEV